MNRIKTVSIWFFMIHSLLQGAPFTLPSGIKQSSLQAALPANTSKVPFMGKIVVSASVQEEICIFYKGKTIEVHKQQIDEQLTSYLFSFLESKSTNVFYMLVASELSFSTKPNTNTLEHLQVLSDKPYTFYKFQGKRFYNNLGQLESYGWDIEVQDLPESGIIPDHTLIIMMSPELLENLESKRWDITTNTRVLPDLIVSSEFSSEQISKMLARSRFASLDLQSLHKNKSREVKQRYRRAVAMLVQ